MHDVEVEAEVEELVEILAKIAVEIVVVIESVVQFDFEKTHSIEMLQYLSELPELHKWVLLHMSL